MKRIVFVLLAALALASCTPQAYRMLCDTQYPGRAGLMLSGKTLGIIYLATGTEVDSVASSISDGLAQGLEAAYFDGRKEIPVFRILKDPAGDYSARDTLVNYLVDINTDVLFLLDVPRLEAGEGASKTCLSDLYVYDSMKRRQEGVVKLNSRDVLSGGALMDSDAQYVGLRYAGYFEKDVRKEFFSVIYYEDWDDDWIEAVVEAVDDHWDSAMNIWMDLMKGTTDKQKLAVASYNMALGCYMLEEYELALEWIQQSEEYMPLSLSEGLKSRIQSAL